MNKQDIDWSSLEFEGKTLVDRIGEILQYEQKDEGVYSVCAKKEDHPVSSYYIIVHKNSPVISSEAKSLGEPFADVLLYEEDGFDGSSKAVQYELYREMVRSGKLLPEGENLADYALYAAELQTNYFGPYPAPMCTPYGCMVRYHVIMNGVFWLETETGKELLALCSVILDDLTDLALKLKESVQQCSLNAMHQYAFFTRRNGCIPLFEILRRHPELSQTVVRKDRVMNTIWRHFPEYAVAMNMMTQADCEGRFLSEILGDNFLADENMQLSKMISIDLPNLYSKQNDKYFIWDD